MGIHIRAWDGGPVSRRTFLKACGVAAGTASVLPGGLRQAEGAARPRAARGRTIARSFGGPVRTDRSPRWEHEAGLESGPETFGAEHNPTGNPIGGGAGYADRVARRDHTARTYDELRQALEEAQAGEVVFLPDDVEIDMSERERLSVPGGVTVAGMRGVDDSPGALLFSDTPRTPGIFSSAGDFGRITGLRIRGPFDGRERTPFSSRGLRVRHYGFEIDNCELSAFSSAAISVGGQGHSLYVHHNHIHHNQRNGLGYGVSLGRVFVLIEANHFDWCRHHIASSGSPGSGYEARYNVCGEDANSHLFDMHGGRDRGDRTQIAGDWLNIHHNTFRSDRRSIGIRGLPSQGARIHHNWFLNPDPENAVRTGGNTDVARNVYGTDRQRIDG